MILGEGYGASVVATPHLKSTSLLQKQELRSARCALDHLSVAQHVIGRRWCLCIAFEAGGFPLSFNAKRRQGSDIHDGV